MVTNSTWSLQKAIFELLSTDASVLNILGGPHVFDHVPRKAPYPFIVFGEGETRNWDTSTEVGDEHTLTFRVWSRGGGKRDNAEIIAVVRSVLAAHPITVDGHHLVNLRYQSADIRRDPAGDIWRGSVRYRAVTEPVAA